MYGRIAGVDLRAVKDDVDLFRWHGSGSAQGALPRSRGAVMNSGWLPSEQQRGLRPMNTLAGAGGKRTNLVGSAGGKRRFLHRQPE